MYNKFKMGQKVLDLSNKECTVIGSPNFPKLIRVAYAGNGESFGAVKDLPPDHLIIINNNQNISHPSIIEQRNLLLEALIDIINKVEELSLWDKTDRSYYKAKEAIKKCSP